MGDAVLNKRGKYPLAKIFATEIEGTQYPVYATTDQGHKISLKEGRPISFFKGREDYLNFYWMSSQEEDFITKEIEENLVQLSKISGSIEELIRDESSAFLKWGGVAKAALCPVESEPCKEYSPHRGLGTLGISWILPKMFRHGPEVPTAYRFLEDAKIYCVQGKRVYLLGNKNEFYHSCNIPGCRSVFVLSMNGFAEVGKTSRISEIQIEIEGSEEVFPVIQNSLTGLPVIEWQAGKVDVDYDANTAMGIPPELSGLHLFQYRTGPMIYITPTQGVKISVVPTRSEIIRPLPLGFAYYESGFLDLLEKVLGSSDAS